MGFTGNADGRKFFLDGDVTLGSVQVLFKFLLEKSFDSHDSSVEACLVFFGISEIRPGFHGRQAEGLLQVGARPREGKTDSRVLFVVHSIQ